MVCALLLLLHRKGDMLLLNLLPLEHGFDAVIQSGGLPMQWWPHWPRMNSLHVGMGQAWTSAPSCTRLVLMGCSRCISTGEPKSASPRGSLQVASPVLEARRGETWAVLHYLAIGPENTPKHVSSPSMKVNNQCRALPAPQVKASYQKAQNFSLINLSILHKHSIGCGISAAHGTRTTIIADFPYLSFSLMEDNFALQ